MKRQSGLARGCLGFVPLCVLSAGAGVSEAVEGPVFYSAGRAHSLIQSDTELAVELQGGTSRAAVAPRALARVGGTLKAVPWGRDRSRFAILEVPAVTQEVVGTARSLAGVRSVQRV